MTVVLTSPVYGKQPLDEFTGSAKQEAWLLASGYAKPQADADYTGPGAAPTGPADVTIANNVEFDKVRGQIAATSDLPEGGTNDGIVLKDADAPYVMPEGSAFGTPPESSFVGFANDPADRPVEFGSVSPATGPAAGGTVLTVQGFGLDKVTSVTFDGVAGTALTHEGRSRLTVTTPVGTAGPADVVLVTAGDDVTEAAGFTYTA